MSKPTSSRARRGVVIIKTVDISVDAMMRGQLRYLHENGLSPLTVIAADTGILTEIAEREGVNVKAVPFRRNPSPLHDLHSLLILIRVLAVLRPRLVIYGTPKAALLGTLASWLTGVPVRLQILHGLRLDTAAGLQRWLLLASERLILRLSTRTIAVSEGLADHCNRLGLDTSKITVLGRGSINGVDVGRFDRRAADTDRGAVHRTWGVTAPQVVGFVGRILPDKGIDALVAAVASLRNRGREVELVLVGPDEGVERLDPHTQRRLGHGWVHLPGPVDDPAEVLGAFDAFCLPSRREGLGMVVLEAWAASTPVVVSDIPALASLVEDAVTGRVAKLDDVDDLASKLESALDDGERTAIEARQIVADHFSQVDVWRRHRDFLKTYL
jgi:glycosyltransferase involved in cell wall biosynthesis